MGTTTETEYHTAHKRHYCTWCGEEIGPGDRYGRYRWWNGDEAGTIKAHPECITAIEKSAEEAGGWYDFTCGENYRGCWCGNNELCTCEY